MQDTIDGDGVLNAMFVICEYIGLRADNLKRSCAARQELVIYIGGDMVCNLILGGDKWWSIQEYIFTRFVN